MRFRNIKKKIANKKKKLDSFNKKDRLIRINKKKNEKLNKIRLITYFYIK